jgi:hypothetical protein
MNFSNWFNIMWKKKSHLNFHDWFEAYYDICYDIKIHRTDNWGSKNLCIVSLLQRDYKALYSRRTQKGFMVCTAYTVKNEITEVCWGDNVCVRRYCTSDWYDRGSPLKEVEVTMSVWGDTGRLTDTTGDFRWKRMRWQCLCEEVRDVWLVWKGTSAERGWGDSVCVRRYGTSAERGWGDNVCVRRYWTSNWYDRGRPLKEDEVTMFVWGGTGRLTGTTGDVHWKRMRWQCLCEEVRDVWLVWQGTSAERGWGDNVCVRRYGTSHWYDRGRPLKEDEVTMFVWGGTGRLTDTTGDVRWKRFRNTAPQVVTMVDSLRGNYVERDPLSETCCCTKRFRRWSLESSGVAPCSHVEVDRNFRGAYCLHHHSSPWWLIVGHLEYEAGVLTTRPRHSVRSNVLPARSSNSNTLYSQ